MTDISQPREGQLTDVHDMIVVHRAFRRELALLPSLIQGVRAGDAARTATLSRHLRLSLRGIHVHHTGEDVMLWPILLERAAPSADVIHRMEAQHGRVEVLVQQLSGLIDRWESGADPAVTRELAATIDELRAALLEHLDDEEEHILPIAARAMSPQEWEAVGQHGFSEIDNADLPILFGMLIEDATPEERKEMFASVPFPARLFLRTVGAWQYRRYVKAVREA